MSTLQELFTTVKNFGLKVRTSGAKGDIAWEEIKPFLPENTQICSGLKWKNDRKTTKDISMSCPPDIYEYVHDVLEMKGGAKKFYKQIVSKIPVVSNDSYRTYKISGFGQIIELDMDTSKLVPLSKMKEVRKGYRTYAKSGKQTNIDTNPND